jgi:hypothetical protein
MRKPIKAAGRTTGKVDEEWDNGAGASRSLNKTISEIMTFLEDDEARPKPAKGVLRPFLQKKIGDLAEYWFKRGVRRGCIEAERQYHDLGTFPQKVIYYKTRELFTGQKRKVRLMWKTKVSSVSSAKTKSKKKGK